MTATANADNTLMGDMDIDHSSIRDKNEQTTKEQVGLGDLKNIQEISQNNPSNNDITDMMFDVRSGTVDRSHLDVFKERNSVQTFDQLKNSSMKNLNDHSAINVYNKTMHSKKSRTSAHHPYNDVIQKCLESFESSIY